MVLMAYGTGVLAMVWGVSDCMCVSSETLRARRARRVTAFALWADPLFLLC